MTFSEGMQIDTSTTSTGGGGVGRGIAIGGGVGGLVIVMLALFLGVDPGQVISQQRDAQCYGMGAHMPAIGQQGHGVKAPSGQDFDHHHYHCQGDDPGDAALRPLVGAVKGVSLATGEAGD